MIVMTTAVVERKKNKCHPYWPTADGVVHGDYILEFGSEREHHDFILRKMFLSKGGVKEKREIMQYHFKGWPDHGVPREPGAVLQFLEDVNAKKAAIAENVHDIGPTLIHCRCAATPPTLSHPRPQMLSGDRSWDPLRILPCPELTLYLVARFQRWHWPNGDVHCHRHPLARDSRARHRCRDRHYEDDSGDTTATVRDDPDRGAVSILLRGHRVPYCNGCRAGQGDCSHWHRRRRFVRKSERGQKRRSWSIPAAQETALTFYSPASYTAALALRTTCNSSAAVVCGCRWWFGLGEGSCQATEQESQDFLARSSGYAFMDITCVLHWK
jgi:hypothetical protein